MRNFLLHFVRAALLVSVGVLVFSTLVSQATAATPPSECSKQKIESNPNIYSCTQGFPPKDCGEQSAGVYKCPGSNTLVQIFDESSSDAGNCTNTCIGAKGIVLYGNTSDFYCYGAQDSKICKYGSAEINVKTGAQKELTEECDITSWGCWVRKLLLAFKNIPVLIPALFPFITFYLVSSAISAMALGLSKAVIWFAVAAMNVSVTPALNQFVADGFAISQQLANLFFLLIFVFIGLATILRIPSYEIKKMLPRLVVVILLINFSGVLVGLVVDIGNLFTNFFLSRALSFDTFGAMQSCVLDIGKNIDKYVFASTYSQLFSMMGIAFSQLFVMAIFSTLLLLVMIVVGVVFLARLVALWIAAILAPLAFASSVLPGTRAFFNQWLDNLIKWAVIGIPIGFFMYLASLLLSSASMADNAGCNMAAGKLLPTALPTDNPLMMFIVGQIPLLAALLILWEGIKMSQKFAPAAAQSAISLGKTIGLGAAGFVGGTALLKGREAIARSSAARQSIQNMTATKNPAWGQNLSAKNPLGWALKGAAAIAGGTQRTTGSLLKTTLIDADKEAGNKMAEKAKKADAVGKLNLLRSGITTESQRYGILTAAVEAGEFKSLTDESTVGTGNALSEQEVRELYAKAAGGKSDKDKKTEKHMRLVYAGSDTMTALDDVKNSVTAGTENATTNGLTADDRALGYANTTQKTVAEAKNEEELKLLSKSVRNSDDFKAAVHDFWRGSQLEAGAKEFGRAFIQTLTEDAASRGSDHYYQVVRRGGTDANPVMRPRNTDLPRFLAGNLAQGLGAVPLEGASGPAELKKRTVIANLVARAPILEEPAEKFARAQQREVSELPPLRDFLKTELSELRKSQNELKRMKANPATSPAVITAREAEINHSNEYINTIKEGIRRRQIEIDVAKAAAQDEALKTITMELAFDQQYAAKRAWDDIVKEHKTKRQEIPTETVT